MKTIKRIAIVLISIFLFITCSKDSSGGETDPINEQNIKYKLDVAIVPEGSGTVSPKSGTYSKGEQVTINATSSSERFEFKEWNGGADGSQESITITMNSDKNITANFNEVPPVYANGEGEIGILGGTIMIVDESSPLNGAYIIIPEGALEEDVNISISLNEDLSFPYDESRQIFDFEPAGVNFLKDIEIGLPYYDESPDISELGIVYYDSAIGIIEDLPVIAVDESNKIIVANTNHFSSYLVWKKDVRFKFEMLEIEGKIGAKIRVEGSKEGVAGLKFIRTIGGVSLSYPNVLESIQYDESRSQHSVFRLFLYEYGDKEKKAQCEMDIYKKYINYRQAFIYNYADNPAENQYESPLYESPFLSSADINDDPFNRNTLGNWFSGDPLVFRFDDFTPSEGKKYYVKLTWLLSRNGNNNTNDTDIYFMNNRKYRMEFNEMNSFNQDKDKNYVDDRYQSEDVNDDTDEDGVIDNLDQCPNEAGPAANGGCPEDADGDGVNDEEDQCPGQDDALIGTSCDDGNPSTSNDIYNNNCECAGSAENLPPSVPANPSPENDSEVTAGDLTLIWSSSDPEGDPLTYEVYFGTSPNPPLVDSQDETENIYNVTDLIEGETYYWKVVVNDDQGNSTTGPIWYFRVVSATTGELTVITNEPTNLSPSSVTLNGNILQVGDQVLLRRGFYISYSATDPPTEDQFDNTLSLAFGGVGPFSIDYSFPELGTPITYRAYAQNSDGIVLGNAVVTGYNGEPPQVSINQPVNNSTFTMGTIVNITGLVNIPNPDTSFAFGEVFIDGTRLEVFNDTAFSYDWDTSSSSIGSHEITVIATNNLQETGTASITIDLIQEQNNEESDIVFNPNLTYGSFTDSRDGNVYKTIQIGNQTWMAQNLAYLPEFYYSSGFEPKKYFVFDYYGNNVTEAKETYNYKTYGVLYNQAAAKDACPQGWHFPTLGEFLELTAFLRTPNTTDDSPIKMIEQGTSHWSSPNDVATNESGFTALPGGRIIEDSNSFHDKGKSFWMQVNVDDRLIEMTKYNIKIWIGFPNDRGLSCRCIKN